MSNDKTNENSNNLIQKTAFGEIKLINIEQEMEDSYLDYAMSVIVSRALPDVRDGLKPVHRRILYAMHEMGLTYQARYRKSAAVVGEVLAKYHPHGDLAVYDSLARMTQDFAIRYPLILGQGNFGSVDGDQPAAMRYTECKMEKISQEMLLDIEKNTVNFIPSYDDTRKEPTVLPAKLPNLLINGTMGIAVGMATNIPPHNLEEVTDAVIFLIDHSDCTVEDLNKFILGPDFPTGAIIYDVDGIRDAYTQGKGKVLMRAKAEIVEDKRGSFQIIVSEIPYQVNKASLVTKIADLVKDKKIKGISDIRDESDKDGIRIVIDLKKDTYPKKILNQLYQYTQMQETFHINMLALVDGLKPQVLNLKDILQEYLKHRQTVIYKKTQFDLEKAKHRIHILKGLKLALKQIDSIINTIKQSQNREDAQTKLEKKFKLTEIQTTAILDMRLSTLSKLEGEKIEIEYKKLEKLIDKLSKILKDPKKILVIIKKELEELKKNYSSERKTKIYKKKIEGFEKEDLIPNQKVIITITRGNYIKRLPITTYRTQKRGGKGVLGITTKEEDLVEHLLIANNHDDILFFTDSGKVFTTKAYEIMLGSRRSKGQAIVNLLQISPDDFITGVLNLSKTASVKHLIMATEKGQIKKCRIANFGKIRKSGLIAIKLRQGDFLKWVRPTTGEDHIILVSKLGQAIKFAEKNVRPMGRSARGIRGIRLRPKDLVVGMNVVSQKRLIKDLAKDDEVLETEDEGRKSISADLMVITENGYGKKTALRNYPIQARGGIGLRTARVREKTGPIVQTKITENEDADIIIISKKGKVIRTSVKNVKRLGRATSGVRLMKLNQADSVASVTLVEKELEEKKVLRQDQDKKKKPTKPMKAKKRTAKKKAAKKPVPKKPVKKPEPKKPAFQKKTIITERPRKTNEPNYWGKDKTLWKKRKIE